MANGRGSNVRELKVSSAADERVTVRIFLVETITILGGASLAPSPGRFAPPAPLFATHLMAHYHLQERPKQFCPEHARREKECTSTASAKAILVSP
jgi:hypothetical protein